MRFMAWIYIKIPSRILLTPGSAMASPSAAPVGYLITVFLLASPAAGAAAPFRRIFAFGDSYTDTGNTHSATGPNAFTYVSRLPYGTTFFHRPTNRYSDGRLVIDFVSESLSLPYLPPYLNLRADASHGLNFAVAGATAIPHDFFARNNLTLDITPQSLQTELRWFDQALERQGCRGSATPRSCSAVFDDALFWVGEIGANDYAYTLGSDMPSSRIQELSIQSVTGFLQAILRRGAKYVVVQGLPPTGCLPLALALAGVDDRDGMGCVASVNRQSYDQNTLLQGRLREIRQRFPGAVILYADFWGAYRTVMANATGYGFRERFRTCCGSGGGALNFMVTAACGSPTASACGDPSAYINWDGVHLTEAMYRAVGDSVLRGPFCRPSFQHLLSVKGRRG